MILWVGVHCFGLCVCSSVFVSVYMFLFVVLFIHGSFSFFIHGRHDSLYARVLRHPNQHIRLCLIVYVSILVFQRGQEGFTTSSRMPLGQHLKNPKKEAHLKNAGKQDAVWASMDSANFVFSVFCLQFPVLAIYADVFLFRCLSFRLLLHCLGHPFATFASNVFTVLA